MAGTTANIAKRALQIFAALMLCAVAITAITLFNPVPAQGSSEDSDTIGITGTQNTAEDGDFSASGEKFAEKSSGLGEDSVLSTANTRTINSKEADPVVVIDAIDKENANTVAAAAEVGTQDPLPTAEHVLPDTSAEGWGTGKASAYSVASSSTVTASGRAFSDTCVTFAVPESQRSKLGHAAMFVYDGKVVVATCTDTGGFEQYGRAFDLGLGITSVFGANTCEAWGVRTVSYRWLN